MANSVPTTIRYGRAPTVDLELANKAYVDGLAAVTSKFLGSQMTSATSNSDRFYAVNSNVQTLSQGSGAAAANDITGSLLVIRHRLNVSSNDKNASTIMAMIDDTVRIATLTVTATTTGLIDSGALTVTVASGSAISLERDASASASGSIEYQGMVEYN